MANSPYVHGSITEFMKRQHEKLMKEGKLFKLPPTPPFTSDLWYVPESADWQPRIHTSNTPDSESGVIWPDAPTLTGRRNPSEITGIWNDELLSKYRDVMGVGDRPRHDDHQDTAKYTKGEPMKLFTFATTKPPAATIWTTLLNADIPASDDLTATQIKYLIFHDLQTNADFVRARNYINTKLNTNQWYGTWDDCGIVISELRKVVTDIPGHFPDWAGRDLYVPYYIAKQLDHSVAFDRAEISDLEALHLSIDSDTTDSRQTAYSLWKFNVDPMTFFSIDMSLEPTPISSLGELTQYLSRKLIDTLANTPDHIIPLGDRITITPFVRVASTATSTTVPPDFTGTAPERNQASEIPDPMAPPPPKPVYEFAVGDVVRLRDGLVPDRKYGHLTFSASARIDIPFIIVDLDRHIGSICHEGTYYSPEMLELVSKGDSDEA